ncbi:hypothetical protein FHX49_001031 [Microbacterium endophyticum]|uniref:Cell wall protein n=1 Tax=Microbacterium endophyticum TaxID=1526412 RepID=A0A7W4V283_9MICO|nr:cell wall protein [Microbacterium endophyticum]MBB2975465.1 hypothetical protein [Microbacterium endophyticum]NIK35516.1 hypothetical protein [Microbacterium endophyticum]
MKLIFTKASRAKAALAKTVAALVLAAAAIVASPLVASASAYPASDSAQVSSATIEQGGAVDLSVADGTFVPGETVTITVTGQNANGITFGMVRFAVETKTYSGATANAAGGLDAVSIHFPDNANGAYNIAVFSSSSPGDTVTVTVGSLPTTGFQSASLLGFWVGGGALVLAGGAIAVAATVHRQRKANA